VPDTVVWQLKECILKKTVFTVLIIWLFFMAGCGSVDDQPNDPTMPTSPSYNTYTVSYNANGGSGTTPDPQTVQVGGMITLSDGSGLYRNGYIFTGWEIILSGLYYHYDAGSKGNYGPNNIIMYAVWFPSTLTGTYSLTSSSIEKLTFSSNGSLSYTDILGNVIDGIYIINQERRGTRALINTDCGPAFWAYKESSLYMRDGSSNAWKRY
jgi:hypothetical protein